jgi:hypothetical protein
MQTALHPKVGPKLDLNPSIFSKHVDNFINVFRGVPVTYLEDRLERRFLEPLDPSIQIYCLLIVYFQDVDLKVC